MGIQFVAKMLSTRISNTLTVIDHKSSSLKPLNSTYVIALKRIVLFCFALRNFNLNFFLAVYPHNYCTLCTEETLFALKSF